MSFDRYETLKILEKLKRQIEKPENEKKNPVFEIVESEKSFTKTGKIDRTGKVVIISDKTGWAKNSGF